MPGDSNWVVVVPRSNESIAFPLIERFPLRFPAVTGFNPVVDKGGL